MATKNIDKFLKDMMAFSEREYKRGALDKFVTIVTMTDKGFSEGFKQGYSKVNTARESEDQLKLTNGEFDYIGGQCVDEVAKWSNKPTTRGTTLEYLPGKKLVYRASRDYKTPYTIAKKKGTDLISAKLKAAGKKELQGANKDKGISARGSEIGLVKSTVHRAHQGVTTVGSAQVSAALRFLDNTRGFAGFATSEEAKEIRNIIREIRATFTTTGTKSGSKVSEVKLNEGLAVNISVLPQNKNKSGSEDYDFKKLKPKLETAIRNYVAKAPLGTMSASDSIEEDAYKRLEYALINELTSGKNAKLKGNKKKPKGRKKKNVKADKEYAPEKTKGSTKKAQIASRTARKPGLKRSNINLAQVMAIFNSRITGTVVKNMGEPALTNRTGRFASSVTVTDVVLTPQGFPSVGYTYQRNPYQTFEKGFAQGTPELDPRDLIDRSIREIAVSMALGRLYTRRQ